MAHAAPTSDSMASPSANSGTTIMQQQQRKRSQSSVSLHNSLTRPSVTTTQRQRTSTGPTNEATSRFVTSSSGFHLPQRSLASTSSYASYSPTLLSPSATVGYAATAQTEGTHINAVPSLPILRRKAAAAALAHASRRGVRRGSMLGKVISSNKDDEDDSEDDEDMHAMGSDFGIIEEDSPRPSNMDDDDDMHIDTGDISITDNDDRGKEEAANRSLSPPSSYSRDSNSTTIAGRRAGQRKANLMYKDRGVLRVAASLRDEKKPAEGEIASEAKLQRKLGPDSESVAPATPKLAAQQSQYSPFAGSASAPTLDRGLDGGDEFCFPDTNHFDISDDSDLDVGDDDGGRSVTPYTNNEIDADSMDAGIAIPGADPEAAQRDRLWMSFRGSTSNMGTSNPRLSPGIERAMANPRNREANPTSSSQSPWSRSFGSTQEQTMDLEPFPAQQSSPSLWGRSAKRKVGDERFEPYSSHAMHKRRAVSPIAFVSAANSRGARASTPVTTLSPGLSAVSQVSPLFLHGLPHQTAVPMNLPIPTPLSIPSPTLSYTKGSGLSNSYPKHAQSVIGPNRSNGVSNNTSTNVSPSSTRPSTPTSHYQPINPYGANPSPSVLNNSSATKGLLHGASPGGASSGGGKVGSGPGYGSGALGLSLGGGSRRYKEEQEEKEEEEGMLGDVSAIRLGEL